VKFTRAATPVPSKRLIWTRAAMPAALCDGSGRFTRVPAGTAGPPADRGSSSRQPALPKAGVWAAAAFGITSISGDKAMLYPAGWTVLAPSANPLAWATQRLESGIQASIGRFGIRRCPSICAAASAGTSVLTDTDTQWPSA
jgi:hypothetical protein